MSQPRISTLSNGLRVVTRDMPGLHSAAIGIWVNAGGRDERRYVAGDRERGRIYLVEPVGPFEDDPNVTNKRFPGNPTQSFRTRHPLRVVAELESWQGHPPDVLQAMLDHLARLREQGLDVIDD